MLLLYSLILIHGLSPHCDMDRSNEVCEHFNINNVSNHTNNGGEIEHNHSFGLLESILCLVQCVDHFSESSCILNEQLKVEAYNSLKKVSFKKLVGFIKVFVLSLLNLEESVDFCIINESVQQCIFAEVESPRGPPVVSC